MAEMISGIILGSQTCLRGGLSPACRAGLFPGTPLSPTTEMLPQTPHKWLCYIWLSSPGYSARKYSENLASASVVVALIWKCWQLRFGAPSQDLFRCWLCFCSVGKGGVKSAVTIHGSESDGYIHYTYTYHLVLRPSHLLLPALCLLSGRVPGAVPRCELCASVRPPEHLVGAVSCQSWKSPNIQ